MDLFKGIVFIVLIGFSQATFSQSIYLDKTKMDVSLGAGMTAEPFANLPTKESLENIIDLPSVNDPENHTQGTHVWVSGGELKLVFDLRTEYDLTHLHFWNYFTEFFDVDDIDFTFFDENNSPVGSIENIEPNLGRNALGGNGNPILAETLQLSFPKKVRFIRATFAGTSNQVDFNNLGFTGKLSSPEPETDNDVILAPIYHLILDE